MKKSRLIPEIEVLLNYPLQEADQALLRSLMEHGSLNDFIRGTDHKKRTVQRRLAKIRKQAAQYGFNAEHLEASTVQTLPIKGKSTLIKHDPPLENGAVLEWIKTDRGGEDLVEALKSVVEGLIVEPVEPKEFKEHVEPRNTVLPLLVIADAHLGLLAEYAETGDASTLRDAEDTLVQAIHTLIKGIQPTKVAYVVNLGDLTHTDGLVAATPRGGNPLDVSNRYFEICRSAGRVMRTAIDLMLTKAEQVQVYNIRGNHDSQTAWHVNEVLRGIYLREERVVIPDNSATTLYSMWGKNMIVMTHGDTGNNQRLYQYITSKWPRQYGNANYTYVMKGHIHSRMVENLGNMVFETFATLAKSDAWHEAEMFKSIKSMSIVNLHPEGGEHSRSTVMLRS